MEAEYRHTQIGISTLLVLLAAVALSVWIAWSLAADGRAGIGVLVVGLALLLLLSFYAATVEVTAGELRYRFGVGLIRRSYPLAEIKSAQAVTNPWYYLWGVKSIPGGWLYAVAPGSAVEITLEDGKVIRLGTDRPQALKHALDEAMAAGQQRVRP